SPEIIESITFLQTAHPDAPFSFFKWLFWRKSIPLDSKEGHYMFRHECYHIRNKHSRDLLFTELAICLFWFNPFFYLYRKEIKAIQEFLADKHAVEQADVTAYAETLLLQAMGTTGQKLINPF